MRVKVVNVQDITIVRCMQSVIDNSKSCTSSSAALLYICIKLVDVEELSVPCMQSVMDHAKSCTSSSPTLLYVLPKTVDVLEIIGFMTMCKVS